jgi:hypothetical protein
MGEVIVMIGGIYSLEEQSGFILLGVEKWKLRLLLV